MLFILRITGNVWIRCVNKIQCF